MSLSDFILCDFSALPPRSPINRILSRSSQSTERICKAGSSKFTNFCTNKHTHSLKDGGGGWRGGKGQSKFIVQLVDENGLLLVVLFCAKGN